ncbi:MAG: WGR domain-containing protein [Sandaracinaceae bacterium]|nr:WGR domain-containing protein [Sandaracinaceae bacterium]
MRRFELVDEGSKKFWEIAQRGRTVRVRFGRIGTRGVEQVREHGTPAEARAASEKLVAEKLRKGYCESAGGEPKPKKQPKLLDAAGKGDVAKAKTAGASTITLGRALLEALRQAPRDKLVEIATELVDRGASLAVTDRFGNSPLTGAVHRDSEALVRLFVERGAPIDGTKKSIPLIVAVENKKAAMVRLLLALGADPNVRLRSHTPLSLAKTSAKDLVPILERATTA